MAHYIILTNILKRHEDKKDIWKKHKRYAVSYNFIDNMKHKRFDDIGCCTSPLALSELISAIRDEFFCEKMYEDGVPFSSWRYPERRKELKDDDIIEINNNILEFLDTMTSIRIGKSKIKRLEERYDLEIISDLIIEKGCRTHDSILLSTAITNDAKYFVTQDRPLRKIDFHKIKIVAPDFFNNKLKNN